MSEKVFGPFDQGQVRNYLPHRFPFLFVDKILEIKVPVTEGGSMKEVGTIVKGIKNATINEPYFVGHFPNMPITPGVVIIETMAQMASFAVLPWVDLDKDMKVQSSFELRLAGVDNARFRKPFFPGDSMMITCEVTRHKGPIWGFKCKGEIEGSLVAETDLLASVVLGEKKV
ncbi:MAG: 3-hydroxyacyl-ACP dehydratase FabZ [Oligoflexia bacterium]|nr:3-hydroxyacyl-ACP dehydratase FabZ [Oligoflexia bacterium]